MSTARIRHLLAPGIEPAQVLPAPMTGNEWRHMWRSASTAELYRFGLRRFADTPTGTLWLFPAVWYDQLPDGLAIVLSDGTRCRFEAAMIPRRESMGLLDFGLFRYAKHRKPC